MTELGLSRKWSRAREPAGKPGWLGSEFLLEGPSHTPQLHEDVSDTLSTFSKRRLIEETCAF